MNNKTVPQIKLATVVLDCPDILELAAFYKKLLGWQQIFEEEGHYLALAPPEGGTGIACQHNPDYVPPVWPEEPGKQQQMVHMDFSIPAKSDMEAAVAHAVACGATVANTQYGDDWTVLFDPLDHPFCFVVW